MNRDLFSRAPASIRPGCNLYDENTDRQGTAFHWLAGVQLHALIAGGRIAQAEAFANEMHTACWCNTRSRWGYNASAYSCGDRYYDDNAWVAKGLMELYLKTNNDSCLVGAGWNDKAASLVVRKK